VAPRVALCLLGPLHIERDGVPLKLNRRRVVALLAHLVVSGQRHYRTSLLTFFSPEYHGCPFRAALRRLTLNLLDERMYANECGSAPAGQAFAHLAVAPSASHDL